jgi:tetratricopeptide (TPR) repeat protein
LALSEALDGLPLAHEQAAAYCARTGLSLADYRKKFQAEPTKFLDAEKDASPGYHNRRTAAKTFALAIDEAAKLHPSAEPLIIYAALLAPEPIPLYLFSDARGVFGEPFASAIADDGLDEAVAALRTFALVDRETIPDERDPSITTDCIRLHRLVRQVAAARREGDALEDAWRRLILAIDIVLPEDIRDDPMTWPRARRLDVIAVDLVNGGRELPAGLELTVVRLLTGLASYKVDQFSDYALAQDFCERALEISERVAGPDGFVTASVLNELALVLRKQKNLGRALQLAERALAIVEKTEGPEDSNTVICVINIARMLQDQGDFPKALVMYKRAVHSAEKTIGTEHPIMAAALDNLAILLELEGKPDEALSLYDRVIEIREKVLGPGHPDTATALSDLGRLLHDQRNFARAHQTLDRALAIQVKVFGPDHPRTKRTADALADSLIGLGRVDEAKALREDYSIDGQDKI